MALTELKTAKESLEAEKFTQRMLNVFFDAYSSFPTAENFDLCIQRMREYQTAWMNGRERPTTREER